MKKSKLYTRTGDTGQTSLIGGARADKDSARLEAYGTLDELNAHIGLLHSLATDPRVSAALLWLQHRLFDIGAYLACPPDSTYQIPVGVTPADITRLETDIDTLDATLPPLNNFVLPSGTPDAAHAHIARTIARRAERRIITLARTATIHPDLLRFINRLSDYLFALARFNNISAHVNEIFWHKDC